MAQAYGVDVPIVHLFKRTTFLIDESGIIRDVISGMPDNHAILEKLHSWPPIAPPSSGVATP